MHDNVAHRRLLDPGLLHPLVGVELVEELGQLGSRPDECAQAVELAAMGVEPSRVAQRLRTAEASGQDPTLETGRQITGVDFGGIERHPQQLVDGQVHAGAS